MGSSMGLGSLASQSSLLDSSADKLIQGVHGNRTPTESAKIDKGAKDFESVLVGSWLQQAEQSFGSVPGGDDSEDVGKDSMMSMGVQTLANAMAASGGIGIGKMVAKAMHAAADKAGAKDGQPAADPILSATTGATLVHPPQNREKR
jgi:Rod binding domain-containing protein